MKKILSLITIILSIFAINVKADEVELPVKTEHEEVNIYLFYSVNCGHCHDFLEYFRDNYEETYKGYFKIVALEVSNSANSKVLSAVKNELGITENGVPVIVIGDFKQIGFGKDGENLIQEALKAYQNESYKDVVAEAIEEVDDDDVKAETLEEALVSAGITTVKEEKAISDGVVIAIIFVVLIGGLGGLVFLARK